MCKTNIWADIRDQRRKDTTWRASRPSCRKNRRKGWQDKVCDRECESDEGCASGPEDPHTGRIQEYTCRARGNLQLDTGVSSWEGVWQSEDRSVTNEGTILKKYPTNIFAVRPHSQESHWESHIDETRIQEGLWESFFMGNKISGYEHGPEALAGKLKFAPELLQCSNASSIKLCRSESPHILTASALIPLQREILLLNTLLRYNKYL